MANQEMFDYLSNKTADYTAITLSVACQSKLRESGKKHQVLHEMDDGSVKVSTISDTSYFDVTLQWPHGVTLSEAGTIMDLWHDTAKANGAENTIYWEHPIDGHTYVIRFMDDLSQLWVGGMINHKQIPSIKVRVEGRKAE